jgi:hypothetical protein
MMAAARTILVTVLSVIIFQGLTYAQRESMYVEPALKFSLEKNKWQQSSRDITRDGEVVTYWLKENKEIQLLVHCFKGEQKYHNPAKSIQIFESGLEVDKINYEKEQKKNTVNFIYENKNEEYPFFCHWFVFNEYYMAECELHSPLKDSKKLKALCSVLLSNCKILHPSEVDSISGLPFNISQRDSLVEAMYSSYLKKLKKRFHVQSSDAAWEDELRPQIIKEVIKEVDKKIKYQFTNLKYLNTEKEILTGKLPIDEWFDLAFLDKESESIQFYNAFNDRFHGEVSDGKKVATSNFFKKQFVSDTSMIADYLKTYLAIVQEMDTIYWTMTLLYDNKTRQSNLQRMYDSISIVTKQYMAQNNITDTFQAEWKVLTDMPLNIFKKDLDTKDTLVIICMRRNQKGEWKMTPTKFGVRAKDKDNDFFIRQDYSIKRERIQDYNITGDFIIYSGSTQSFIGNNKIIGTNFIPVPQYLDTLLKEFDIVYRDFKDAHFKNSSSMPSELSDSIDCDVFVADYMELLTYDSILSKSNYSRYVDTSKLEKIITVGFSENGSEKSAPHIRKSDAMKQFFVNYLHHIPPEKRVYISELVYDEDINADGKDDVYQVTISNGIVKDVVLIQLTKEGVRKLIVGGVLMEKILNRPVIQMMMRISKIRENVLNKKLFSYRLP